MLELKIKNQKREKREKREKRKKNQNILKKILKS
jgi:hypothetical protein